jgi:hypothetical protein
VGGECPLLAFGGHPRWLPECLFPTHSLGATWLLRDRIPFYELKRRELIVDPEGHREAILNLSQKFAMRVVISSDGI